MPIIQTELQNFCKIWNLHKIRKQTNRPNCVPGQPLRNYMYPEATGTTDHGCVVPDDVLRDFVDMVDDISMQASS